MEPGWMRIANIQNGGSCPNGWKQILTQAKACMQSQLTATQQNAIQHF